MLGKMLRTLKRKEAWQQPVRVEAQHQKRKVVTRAESDETQEYASERRRCGDIEQEEAEELRFVPSGHSEPLWALHTCDSKCSEQGCKVFQLAATVMAEGGRQFTQSTCASTATLKADRSKANNQ